VSYDVAINLLSTLLAFAGGWLFKAGLNRWKNIRPAKRVWQLTKKDSVLIVVGDHPHVSATNPTVFEADALAATGIAQYLGQVLRVDSRVLRIAGFSASRDMEKDIVVIGGPAHNKLYATMADRLSIPYQFVANAKDAEIINASSKAVFGMARTETEITRDSAIIVIARNPFNAKSTLVMLAGCSSLGTVSASRMLTHQGVRQLARMHRTRHPVAVIVETEMIDGYNTFPKVVDLVSL
jgi:hypothetical protein